MNCQKCCKEITNKYFQVDNFECLCGHCFTEHNNSKVKINMRFRKIMKLLSKIFYTGKSSKGKRIKGIVQEV